MDITKLNEDLQNFWNDEFKKLKSKKIIISEIKVESDLDKAIKFMGDNTNKLLDIGSGSGYALFNAKILGNRLSYGLGIDSSINAIKFAIETIKLSNIEGLDFKVADHNYLKKLKENSFDGIICSNVLDVIPKETANEIINEIKRLLKTNGYLLLKFNFYLTKEIIEKNKMKEIEKNTYTLNGVLRGVNSTIKEWLEKFQDFKIIKEAEYARVKNGPKDRVLLLKNINRRNRND